MQDRPTLFLEVIQRHNHQVREGRGGVMGALMRSVVLLRMYLLFWQLKLKGLQLNIVNSELRTSKRQIWSKKILLKKPVGSQSEGARKTRVTKVVIGVCVASDWLRGWHEVSNPITERSLANAIQSRIAFDYRWKTAVRRVPHCLKTFFWSSIVFHSYKHRMARK